MVYLKDYKSVDLTNVVKSKNRIYRLGIELEGGWDKPPKSGKIERDGSVAVDCIYAQGELPSPPLAVEDYKQWMIDHYPHKVNDTCGMHIHMSFQSALTYQRLMDPKYPATILAYVRKWSKDQKLKDNHPIWHRLNGDSPYCRHQFTADDQVMAVDKDFNRERRGNRYTVVNYCWSRTSTLECRLLPAMSSVELAIDAIDNLINITNGFLVATAKKEAKVRGEGLLNPKVIEEVRNIRLR